MVSAKKNSHFIPSPYKVVTEYEDVFAKQGSDATKNALKDVLKYIAKITASTIKNNEFDVQDYLKAFDNDIEKARMVGDVISIDGKEYIWTEYSPGKFDWHVKKHNSVLQGVGVSGKHGKEALKLVYNDIDSSYDKLDKMNLKRTPNGHWRLFYDNNDTGKTIKGDVVTEDELMKDNICYQRRMVVDNFDMMKDYMQFDSSDDVYFVQVIKRWKDNKDKPGAEQWRSSGKAKGSYHSGAEYLEYYLIHDDKELNNVKNEIIKSCSYSNARAYITINSRSEKQSNDYIKKFKSRFTDHNDPRYKNAEPIVYGMPKSGDAWKDTRLRVLLDIDTTRDSKVKINGVSVNVWDEVKNRLQQYNIKVAASYETPSGGLHLILNNKNNRNMKPFFKGLSDFDGGKNLGNLAMVHPSEDIKMVLYSNVDTEEY